MFDVFISLRRYAPHGVCDCCSAVVGDGDDGDFQLVFNYGNLTFRSSGAQNNLHDSQLPTFRSSGAVIMNSVLSLISKGMCADLICVNLRNLRLKLLH